jgi:hypothetical protein
MLDLGLILDYTGFLEAYEQRKDLLLDYIHSKAVSPADISELIKRDPADFLWEIVFVEEGQDWPANEIDILRAIYGPERIVVADGVDQFIRGSVADWAGGLTREHARAG